LRPGCPVATSLEAWFPDGVGWFPARTGSRPWKISMEPGMFMKIKQLSEKSQSWDGFFRKTKYLKSNRLSIFIVGYHEAGKR
jgi:hypothetical protein